MVASNGELSTAQLAERTGVPAGTLRMWESRYEFPTPVRLPGGHRRYSDDDVEQIREVARLRAEGLSMIAAIQAPVIMMSQNRQDTRDRVRGELDYEVNRRAESEIQGLSSKLNLLGEKMGDFEDLLRKRLP